MTPFGAFFLKTTQLNGIFHFDDEILMKIDFKVIPMIIIAENYKRLGFFSHANQVV